MKHIARWLIAAAFAVAISANYDTETSAPQTAHAATFNETAAAEMPQECDPRGCGFIDFDAHPELIGGGIVLEDTE